MDNFVCVDDYQKYAYYILPKMVLDYYKSGAGQEQTADYNHKAFSKIRPRNLRNVAKRDLSTVVLGEKIEIPIGISPSAMQKLAHPEGECAMARAAQSLGTIYTLSTVANTSIEDVAKEVPNCLKWFQLYIYRDRTLTQELVKRAELAGYKALVLTVDAPVCGMRYPDIRNNFQLPPHLTFANFQGTNSRPQEMAGSNIGNYVDALYDANVQWHDIKWLQTLTKMPIVIKGILTAEDAKLALDYGAKGIWVSNHGGRQLDGTPASIETLPEIIKAVDGRAEVYLDGGVSDGTDVFKALALGAKMVFLGRTALWGLAHSGEKGVRKILEILKTELDFAMALSGCATLQEIDSNRVVPQGYYNKL